MGQFYRHVYAPKSDLRIVILALVLIASGIQWMIAKQRYDSAMRYFRNSDKIKRMATQIQAERRVGDKKGGASRRMSSKDKKKIKAQEKEELEEIIDELMGSIEIT